MFQPILSSHFNGLSESKPKCYAAMIITKNMLEDVYHSNETMKAWDLNWSGQYSILHLYSVGHTL